jgi:hypothetical protein
MVSGRRIGQALGMSDLAYFEYAKRERAVRWAVGRYGITRTNSELWVGRDAFEILA